MSENEVAKTEDVQYDVALAKEMGFDFTKNFENGAEPRLPVVKIMHQGQMFKIGEDKDESFVGTILHYQRTNAYWEESFDQTGAGTPPDCASRNGRVPTDGDSIQADSCAKCQWNKFGSDGKGKKCKNMYRMHILRDGDLLPIRIVVPATSMKNVDEYLTTLANKQLHYCMAKTKFSLVSAQSSGNIEYSKLVLSLEEVCQDMEQLKELKAQIDQYGKQFDDEVIDEDVSFD